MATNHYFSQGRKSEQLLYEDLIVESLKMYGQDVYYLPRESIDIDAVFKDESSARFDTAYKIEMYIETIEGFDGEGDLFTKFGVEIRDQATFVVARKRWKEFIAPMENDPDTEGQSFYRPREGDLIHLPLSNSIFQIMKVFDETPFYQLKNLPVFRLSCELYEYSSEDFDTGISEIDAVENFGYRYLMTLNGVSGPGVSEGIFEIGEHITQDNGTYTMSADVVDWNAVTNVLTVVNVGSSDGLLRSFGVVNSIVGEDSQTTARPVTIVEEIENATNEVQNAEFETIADGVLDFSESNPFGDP